MADDVLMERAKGIAALPGFDAPRWWLTFYLTGNPESLHRLSLRLAERGAVNLCRAEGGFTYPKLEVASYAAAVAGIVAELRQAAAEADVTLLSVDVDTSPSVEASKFKELIRFGANGS